MNQERRSLTEPRSRWRVGDVSWLVTWCSVCSSYETFNWLQNWVMKKRRGVSCPDVTALHFVTGSSYWVRIWSLIWYGMIWYMIWHDMVWYMIWCGTIRYDMIWYDISFHRWQRSVDLYKNRIQTTVYSKGETKYRTIQKRRIHKVENKYTKQGNKLQKNVKNLHRVIRK